MNPQTDFEFLLLFSAPRPDWRVAIAGETHLADYETYFHSVRSWDDLADDEEVDLLVCHDMASADGGVHNFLLKAASSVSEGGLAYLTSEPTNQSVGPFDFVTSAGLSGWEILAAMPNRSGPIPEFIAFSDMNAPDIFSSGFRCLLARVL